MSEQINTNNFETSVKNVAEGAKDYLKNPDGLEALLQKFEAYLKEVPYVGETASKLPLMVSMIRSYITKEYTEVSPKVVGSLIALILYLLKEKDLIPDNIPIIGRIDDIAAIVLVLKFNEKELNDYSAWRENRNAPVQPEKAAEPAAAETPAETAEPAAVETPAETAEPAAEETPAETTEE